MKGVYIFMILTGIALVAGLGDPGKVKLSDIKTLSFSSHSNTTSRGDRPNARQMQCSGEFCHYAPSTMKCTNEGSDGVDPVWHCVSGSKIPDMYRLADIHIDCEDYDIGNPTYVTRGSCAVKFRIELNPAYPTPVKAAATNENSAIYIMVIFGIAIILISFTILIYAGCSSGQNDTTRIPLRETSPPTYSSTESTYSSAVPTYTSAVPRYSSAVPVVVPVLVDTGYYAPPVTSVIVSESSHHHHHHSDHGYGSGHHHHHHDSSNNSGYADTHHHH
ncbi:MAG: store-operated calcium entry-associated regulatory factor [Hyperionvirus sp.]|uniref:Store-operated calcium entry-associated regulatory factor n=1 Tax=Hyperionvirus sp. TaxID=2487770 RepID=A0A3G5ABS2_9VIRU|nr:MAG: store-operated calcium entry-associated regulatory factor [Hyperionvirus sp.]